MIARRIAVFVVLTICVLYGVGNLIYSLTTWPILPDMDAYWNAAIRIRAGDTLYLEAVDINAADVYRYAPWFAIAWVPLTHLPREVVHIGWSIALLIASLAAVGPISMTGRPASIALASLVGSFLLLSASYGNVQPLIVAALVHGVDRRSGPIWISLAASLKATPILFALIYFAKGEKKKAASTIVLTAILVAPALLFDLTGYTTNPGWSHSLYVYSPFVFALVALASIVVAAQTARRAPRFGWLAASVAVILSLPRFFPYELTYLLVGKPARERAANFRV